MTSYKNYCHKSAKKIDDFLAENPELGPKHLQVLEKLNTDLEEHFKRMEISWFSMMDDIVLFVLFLCNANSVLRCRFLYIQFTLYWMGHVPLINPFLGFCNIARGTHSSMLR